jgi:hypothetical protein
VRTSDLITRFEVLRLSGQVLVRTFNHLDADAEPSAPLGPDRALVVGARRSCVVVFPPQQKGSACIEPEAVLLSSGNGCLARNVGRDVHVEVVAESDLQPTVVSLESAVELTSQIPSDDGSHVGPDDKLAGRQ